MDQNTKTQTDNNQTSSINPNTQDKKAKEDTVLDLNKVATATSKNSEGSIISKAINQLEKHPEKLEEENESIASINDPKQEGPKVIPPQPEQLEKDIVDQEEDSTNKNLALNKVNVEDLNNVPEKDSQLKDNPDDTPVTPPHTLEMSGGIEEPPKAKRNILSWIIFAVVILLIIAGIGYYFLVIKRPTLITKPTIEGPPQVQQEVDIVIQETTETPELDKDQKINELDQLSEKSTLEDIEKDLDSTGIVDLDDELQELDLTE